jgi:hypothetical protein
MILAIRASLQYKKLLDAPEALNSSPSLLTLVYICSVVVYNKQFCFQQPIGRAKSCAPLLAFFPALFFTPHAKSHPRKGFSCRVAPTGNSSGMHGWLGGHELKQKVISMICPHTYVYIIYIYIYIYIPGNINYSENLKILCRYQYRAKYMRNT